MKNKKVQFLFKIVLIFFISWVEVKAQSPLNTLSAKIRSIIYYAPGHDFFGNKQYENRAFTFGIAIGVNSLGKVDTVIFTNKTKALDSIVSFKYITQQLKKERSFFLPYKNAVLVSVVLVRRSWDKQIGNFYDYYYKNKSPDLTDFDEYFLGILPDVEKISKSKRVKILPSIDFIQPKARH